MIAVLGSHIPAGNAATARIGVATMPTPPPNPHFVATGLKLKERLDRTFHVTIATSNEPHAKAQDFQASINWDDHSAAIPG